jgi:phage shock protein C
MKKIFQLDKSNAVLLGVCGGIAKLTGIDATFVRIGAVLLTLLGGFPWTVVAYGAFALIANPGAYRRRPAQEERPRASIKQGQAEMRDIDRRMAEVETYVATTNSSLAREIESLR